MLFWEKDVEGKNLLCRAERGKFFQKSWLVTRFVQLLLPFYPKCEVEFMGKQSSVPGREEVLRKMYSLAGVRFNDVVRLAFLTQEQADQIDKLNLAALKEFKRAANGAVEIKLIDRAQVLENVLELLERPQGSQGNDFLRALEDLGKEGGTGQ